MSEDLTGKRYGRLTVIGISEKRGSRGKKTTPLWECHCDCGAIVYRATDTLKNDDVCMCAACAKIRNTQIARQYAGFVGGTQITKLKSSRPMASNVSGVRGVSYDKRSGMWRARLTFRGQKMNLGYYRNLEDAVEARKKAEEQYYGEFLAAYGMKTMGGKYK